MFTPFDAREPIEARKHEFEVATLVMLDDVHPALVIRRALIAGMTAYDLWLSNGWIAPDVFETYVRSWPHGLPTPEFLPVRSPNPSNRAWLERGP
jgi:hypothetical protein